MQTRTATDAVGIEISSIKWDNADNKKKNVRILRRLQKRSIHMAEKKENARNPYAGTKTEKNLWEAFAGESQARNKYTR